jgi:hypothetical protein
LSRSIEPLQALHRLDVLGVDHQNLAIRLDGVGGDVQLLLVDDGHLVVELDLSLRFVGYLEASVVDIDQIVPCLQLEVDSFQGIERLFVVLFDLQHLMPGANRLLGLVEMALVDAGDLLADRDDLVGLVRCLGLAFEHIDQIRPAPLLLVQALQALQCHAIIGIDRENLAERLDRVIGLVELFVIGLPEASPQLDLGIGIGFVVDTVAQDARHLRPGLDTPVHRLQKLQQLVAAGLDVEGSAQVIDSLVGLLDGVGIDPTDTFVQIGGP